MHARFSPIALQMSKCERRWVCVLYSIYFIRFVCTKHNWLTALVEDVITNPARLQFPDLKRKLSLIHI